MPHFLRFPKSTLLPFMFAGSALCMVAQSGPAVDPLAFAGAPFSSTVEELRAASAAMPADHEFQVQVLLEEGTYKMAADGSHSYRYRLIFRVDSKEALENWAEM